MISKSSLFDISIVEVYKSVEWFFNFTSGDCFLHLFSWVRVETHFPLSDPVINLLQVFIKIIRRGI